MSKGSKAKAQGTAFESELKFLAENHLGQEWTVTRMADGGSKDEGDLLLTRINSEFSVVIEAKDMMQGNIHREVKKANVAARGRLSPVAWKRRVRKDGNTNRTQPYPPIVAMSVHQFFMLLWKAGEYERNRQGNPTE